MQFFASLILIFGLEVILGVLGLLYSSQLEDEVTTELKQSLKSYKEEPIMDTWDRLQTNVSSGIGFKGHHGCARIGVQLTAGG